MKVLTLGDPHCKVTNLHESNKLLNFAFQLAISKNIDRIVILGDLFNNHAILRVEVLDFWNSWLELLSDRFQTVVLTGNHDLNGDKNDQISALNVFKHIDNGNLIIIESPLLDAPFGYMPYFYDNDSFVKEANSLVSQGAQVIVCHQTPNGAKYDNGMYAPEGFSPDAIKANLVICGHIHCRQRFDKIIIPGTARWLDNNDLNQIKGVWITTHDDKTGELLNEEFVDTSAVCTPILSFIWEEGGPMPSIPTNSRSTVELVGSSEWIKQSKIKIKGIASIKTKITDKHKIKGRKANLDIYKFIDDSFEPIAGIEKDKILEYIRNIYVK